MSRAGTGLCRRRRQHDEREPPAGVRKRGRRRLRLSGVVGDVPGPGGCRPGRLRPHRAGGGRGRSELRASGGTDRGSASVWCLAVGTVLLAAGLAATSLGAAQVARHQAQAAADLAALAGAPQAVRGPDAACQRAAEIAAANRARLVGCRVEGLDVVVTVEVGSTLPAPRPASATARAGPVRADDSAGRA
ncbi:MAG: flp pilus-assembly TadE/G-like family protein [Micromonosporaceae bacterium]